MNGQKEAAIHISKESQKVKLSTKAFVVTLVAAVTMGMPCMAQDVEPPFAWEGEGTASFISQHGTEEIQFKFELSVGEQGTVDGKTSNEDGISRIKHVFYTEKQQYDFPGFFSRNLVIVLMLNEYGDDPMLIALNGRILGDRFLYGEVLLAEHEEGSDTAKVLGVGNPEATLMEEDELPNRLKSVLRKCLPIGIVKIEGDYKSEKASAAAGADAATAFTQITTHPSEDDTPEWSPDGAKIIFASKRSGNWDIWAMDPDGTNKTNLTNHVADEGSPGWSPDGTKIVFCSDRDGDQDIYVMDADGSNVKRLAGFPGLPHSSGWDAQPAWSPDGQRIAWARGVFAIWIMNSDGSNQRKLVLGMGDVYYPQWSPDGEYVYFMSDKGHYAQFEVWRIQADGTEEAEQITNDGNNHDTFRFNPADPTKVAFMMDIGGRSNHKVNLEIYIMNTDGSGMVNITNLPAYDRGPSWSPDGTQIAFSSKRSTNLDIWVASLAVASPVATGPTPNGAVTLTRPPFGAGFDALLFCDDLLIGK